MNEDIWSTFFLFIIMVAVLLGAYFTTKFISGRTSRIHKNKYIQIYDRMVISKDKQIVLLEVGGSVFMVGFSGQSVSLIGTLDSSGFQKATEDTPNKGIIQNIADYISKAKEAQNSFNKARMQRKRDEQPPEDDVLEKMARSAERRRNRIRNQQGFKSDDSAGMDE